MRNSKKALLWAVLLLLKFSCGDKETPTPIVDEEIIEPITAGLVASYAFEHEENLVSSVGTIGASVKGPKLTADRNGNANKALLFDGVDDFVTLGTNTAFAFKDQFSFAVWVKSTGDGNSDVPGATGSGIIFNKEGEYELARFANGAAYWALANTKPGWSWAQGSNANAIEKDKWTHIVFTYHKDQGAATYINGALAIKDATASGAIGDYDTKLNSLFIGGREGYKQFFKGAMDDLKIFNRALTATEAQLLSK